MSPATRFDAKDVNATNRPVADIAGRKQWLLAGVPSVATLTRTGWATDRDDVTRTSKAATTMARLREYMQRRSVGRMRGAVILPHRWYANGLA